MKRRIYLVGIACPICFYESMGLEYESANDYRVEEVLLVCAKCHYRHPLSLHDYLLADDETRWYWRAECVDLAEKLAKLKGCKVHTVHLSWLKKGNPPQERSTVDTLKRKREWLLAEIESLECAQESTLI